MMASEDGCPDKNCYLFGWPTCCAYIGFRVITASTFIYYLRKEQMSEASIFRKQTRASYDTKEHLNTYDRSTRRIIKKKGTDEGKVRKRIGDTVHARAIVRIYSKDKVEKKKMKQ